MSVETYIVRIDGGVVSQVIEMRGLQASETTILNRHEDIKEAMQRLGNTPIGGRGVYSGDDS